MTRTSAALSAAGQPRLGGGPPGLLITGHGLYAWGKDLFSANRHLEILEFLLEQRWRQLLLQGLGSAAVIEFSALSAVVLDIEGTTCPVDFVCGHPVPLCRQIIWASLLRHGETEAVQAPAATGVGRPGPESRPQRTALASQARQTIWPLCPICSG